MLLRRELGRQRLLLQQQLQLRLRLQQWLRQQLRLQLQQQLRLLLSYLAPQEGGAVRLRPHVVGGPGSRLCLRRLTSRRGPSAA